MQMKSRKAAGVAFLVATTIAGAGALTAAQANQGSSARPIDGPTSSGRLLPLNNSGAEGKALVQSQGRRLHVEVDAHQLAPDLPHAQHIHFGAQARHECPSVFDDNNGDFRLTTSEGQPAYGPVRVSLTTSGDTSPDSVLAVDRFPTAPGGDVDYARNTTTSKKVARAIRHGEAVVVVHGVDYNHNGTYDFDSAGASELNGEIPAEATDPAVCGVLHAE